ncbi:probable E3 SUMO-protein ligase RNF212 [Brachyistius frenatus]|uniref:probable E3 SUMO-protein ligase RNF212 n=1 Tax=Brachyistius frenatus TaxID=100188 RepID=UPI0037E85C6B
MSHWVCCNSCFLSPSAERKLAVTTCGHIVCSVCYQKGQQGKCLICSASCQISALSDKSGSDVKALFSDINVVANKHFAEISKVVMFQARHQKRLLTYYQQRNEKLEEAYVKVKQEVQQMIKQLNEQSVYITKLENSLQSAKASSQVNHGSHAPRGHKPVLQIPYKSPVSLLRRSSASNRQRECWSGESMEVDEGILFRKPNSAHRGSFINPAQDGRMATVPHRLSNQNTSANHLARSAPVSRFQGAPLTPDITYGRTSGWKSPLFKPPSSFRHSMSSLVCPPP